MSTNEFKRTSDNKMAPAILLFCTLLSLKITKCQAQDNYIGAVVDYAPYHNISESAEENLSRNVDEYITFIQKAKKQNADIIVFPECGVTSLYFPHINRAKLMEYTSEVPNARHSIIPCNNGTWTNTIKRLSCSAKENQIYVVVNLPERYTYQTSDSDSSVIIFYNTNVVFDRNGAVIARYRKYNLFGEVGFNRTEIPEEVSFETDFGVTFGTFICFDILFADPATKLLLHNNRVTDIVYPTAWFSELPFLSAVQTQSGWARANGVNLLASGYNEPSIGSGGSGVYTAHGDLHYVMPTTRGSQLIVQRIPKIKHRMPPNTDLILPDSSPYSYEDFLRTNEITRSIQRMRTKKENITFYSTVLLNNTNVENTTVCYGEFCCLFTIKFIPSDNVDYRYRMVTYKGPRLFGVEVDDIQICGLVACRNEAIETCGERVDNPVNSKVFTEIKITGNFRNDDDTVIFPSNTLYSMSILPHTYVKYNVTVANAQKIIEMRTTKQVNGLLGFGIYAVTKSVAHKFTPMLPLIYMSVILL